MAIKRASRGESIDGVIVVDKPTGMTSNDVVQRVKKITHATKVGHTGSLDRLATGVLPLCLGQATKFSQYLLNSDKRYEVELELGRQTDTGDASGQVIAEHPVDQISDAQIESVLAQFRGELRQIPPMYSAIKKNGKPLHKLARKGIEIEREPRDIKVYANELIGRPSNDVLQLAVFCSKGTYIRTLVSDIGNTLGCGAHVANLRRTAVGAYELAEAVSIEAIRDAVEAGFLERLLKSVASTVSHWPTLNLNNIAAYYIRQGQQVSVDQNLTQQWVVLNETPSDSSTKTRFIGIGEVLDNGCVAPRRLVV